MIFKEKLNFKKTLKFENSVVSIDYTNRMEIIRFFIIGRIHSLTKLYIDTCMRLIVIYLIKNDTFLTEEKSR